MAKTKTHINVEKWKAKLKTDALKHVEKMNKLYYHHPITYKTSLKVLLEGLELYQKGLRGKDIRVFAKDKITNKKLSKQR